MTDGLITLGYTCLIVSAWAFYLALLACALQHPRFAWPRPHLVSSYDAWDETFRRAVRIPIYRTATEDAAEFWITWALVATTPLLAFFTVQYLHLTEIACYFAPAWYLRGSYLG